MSENTDTPITDKAWKKSFRHDHIAAEFIRDEMAKLERQLAEAKWKLRQSEDAFDRCKSVSDEISELWRIGEENLKKQLTEATAQYGRSLDELMTERDEAIEQRDRLAEALRKIASNPGWMDEEFGFMSGHIAKEALATLDSKN